MKRVSNKKRHCPEEIVSKLREADEAIAQGRTSGDVAKTLGVSLTTVQRWRTEYGSSDRDAVTREEELEPKTEASSAWWRDQALDIQILKEVPWFNSLRGILSPARRGRTPVEFAAACDRAASLRPAPLASTAPRNHKRRLRNKYGH